MAGIMVSDLERHATEGRKLEPGQQHHHVRHGLAEIPAVFPQFMAAPCGFDGKHGSVGHGRVERSAVAAAEIGGTSGAGGVGGQGAATVLGRYIDQPAAGRRQEVPGAAGGSFQQAGVGTASEEGDKGAGPFLRTRGQWDGAGLRTPSPAAEMASKGQARMHAPQAMHSSPSTLQT